MRSLIVLIAAILAPAMALSQQEPLPQNPNTFGNWTIETDSGMTGRLVIEGPYCHYSIVSSFAALQSPCYTIWSAESNTLIVGVRSETGSRNSRAFTVPDYQPGRSNYSSTQTLHSEGDSSYSFQITQFGRGWMKGHLLGAGAHESVTLTRH